MNENQNVKNVENSKEASQLVSSLIGEIFNNSVPLNVSQSSVAASRCSNPSSSVQNAGQSVQESTFKTSTQFPLIQSDETQIKSTLEIYRTVTEFNDSQSDVAVGICMTPVRNADPKNKHLAPPSVPPSYSTVIKQGRPSLDIRRDVRSMETQHISPFTRIPPPSYSEIQGVWSRDFSNASSEQVLLGPDPIYIWCAQCSTVVITVTEPQRSKFTHFTAAALCLFGCWPCAMLPYFMNSCKNIYHYCPECNYLFGMYRPW